LTLAISGATCAIFGFLGLDVTVDATLAADAL
jgi:hypothetical protein